MCLLIKLIAYFKTDISSTSISLANTSHMVTLDFKGGEVSKAATCLQVENESLCEQL